jgi:hypothetical protein
MIQENNRGEWPWFNVSISVLGSSISCHAFAENWQVLTDSYVYGFDRNKYRPTSFLEEIAFPLQTVRNCSKTDNDNLWGHELECFRENCRHGLFYFSTWTTCPMSSICIGPLFCNYFVLSAMTIRMYFVLKDFVICTIIHNQWQGTIFPMDHKKGRLNE